MEIVFATQNKAKLREIREIMESSGIKVISMSELGIDIDVEETGTTFAENAAIKASHIMNLTGKIVLADDSGLEIDFLDKAPGIHSARYMGKDTSYDIKNQKILDLLEGVPREKRTARFVCVIAAAFPGNSSIILERADFEGIIADKSAGNEGFGYDPIFFVPEYNMTASEMSREQKNLVSHRGKALGQMRLRLSELIQNMN